ncbi:MULTISPECIES: maleylpyruvate isomerase N-terminal domain-containing protein [unclassified Streptomyces]|uniref:maleylpyruvate isomerase N-terminal domain-containing protein n=1 Tax=unclassified Streptomyces TaxID=2593676 RepID=UPI00101329B6|nr:maleylpyruvate isomerase N-terminal domain-containing protein [Streptomyces sp. GZWMJZ-114]
MSGSTSEDDGARWADDVRASVACAVAALAPAATTAGAASWSAPAGPLTWSCWETGEHLADDLFAYAAQLTPAAPPSDDDVPFRWESTTPGGPANTIRADPAHGPAGLLRVIDACGGLLAAAVRVTPPDVRAHHTFGRADAAGFAAMGIVETLVHTDDLAQGLGLAWTPPEGLAARALDRLFPDVPRDLAPAWPTLRWATGRTSLPGLPDRANGWRWDGRPAGERG